MISGEKILVTGASGEIGRKLGKFLAQENEVWALARYAAQSPEAKEKALAAATGAHMRPIAIDLGAPDFSELPQDFTYVLHLAHTRRGPAEFIESIDINAVGAGLLLQHCRKAKAALVMSSTAVYSPPADPFEALSERSDIGRAFAPWAPSSPVSKVSLEAVARFCAEAFGLPVAVMRLNTVYGPEMNVMPVLNMDAVVRGDRDGARVGRRTHRHGVRDERRIRRLERGGEAAHDAHRAVRARRDPRRDEAARAVARGADGARAERAREELARRSGPVGRARRDPHGVGRDGRARRTPRGKEAAGARTDRRRREERREPAIAPEVDARDPAAPEGRVRVPLRVEGGEEELPVVRSARRAADDAADDDPRGLHRDRRREVVAPHAEIDEARVRRVGGAVGGEAREHGVERAALRPFARDDDVAAVVERDRVPRDVGVVDVRDREAAPVERRVDPLVA